MRIFYLCPYAPASTATGGGPVFGWQNVAALQALGHEVHLVPTTGTAIPDDVRERVASVTHCLPIAPSWRSPDRVLSRVFRDETLPFRFRDWGGVLQQVRAALERIGPDVIFADWIGSLLYLPPNLGVPVVYAHHDFLHQLRAVRERGRSRLRLRRPDVLTASQLRKKEEALVRNSSRVLTVSASDERTIRELGVECRYVPIIGAPIERIEAVEPAPVRAVLLGRSNTAMNATRRNLRERIWPLLDSELRSRIEWHQVGEVPQRSNPDWRWVEENFVVHGFVENLSDVLRPGDLCLVPYRDDTGFRAKFVTAAAHGMVNIGYRESFACAQEFRHSETCLAASDDRDFVRLLRQWSDEPELRARMSSAARALYERAFGLSGVLPTYEWALGAPLVARA